MEPALRDRWGRILLGVGLAVLSISFGQYGFMLMRQWQMRARWTGAVTLSRTAAADPRRLRLIIPRIQLDDVVVRGTNYMDLLVAPGLLNGTPPPGPRGNTVIAGHRDTFFRNVAQLRDGDRIRLESAGSEYGYRVTGVRIVAPTDTAPLVQTAEPQLTLVTCYPTYWIGPAPKRLIVRAALESVRPLSVP